MATPSQLRLPIPFGGSFHFWSTNRPQKHQKRAILHTFQANWGLQPPPAPSLATLLLSLYSLYYAKVCNKFTGPVFAILRPGNTAPIKEMSQRRRAVSTLTGTRFELQTFYSVDERVATRPTPFSLSPMVRIVFCFGWFMQFFFQANRIQQRHPDIICLYDIFPKKDANSGWETRSRNLSETSLSGYHIISFLKIMPTYCIGI